MNIILDLSARVDVSTWIADRHRADDIPVVESVDLAGMPRDAGTDQSIRRKPELAASGHPRHHVERIRTV